MGFSKRLIYANELKFAGANKYIDLGDAPWTDWRGKSFVGNTGVGYVSGRGKMCYTDYITAGNSAITTGIAAQTQTAGFALTGLTAAAQTILAAALSAQPDVPRAVRFVAAKTGATAIGNGTMTGNAIVIVTGVKIDGVTVTEWIPLNDTAAVNSVYSYLSITSVILPAKVNATGDQVSMGYANVFPFYRPVASTADVLEAARKASAATAYTTETLGTLYLGNASQAITNAITPTTTSIALTASSVVGTMPTSGINHFDIIRGDGRVIEKVSGTVSANVLTAVRGIDGTVAQTWDPGQVIAYRPGQNWAPTSAITANDRMKMTYLSAMV